MQGKDQPPNKFLHRFIIVPLELVNKDSGKAQLNKSLQIKLGKVCVKCEKLSTPVYIDTEVDYDVNNKNFMQLKGMIKIYDILEDGNEIISCLGTFETDSILNSEENLRTIVKNIGSTTLTMQISCNLLSRMQSETSNSSNEKLSIKNIQTRMHSQISSKPPPNQDHHIGVGNCGSLIKGLEDQFQESQSQSCKNKQSSFRANFDCFEGMEGIEDIPMKKKHVISDLDLKNQLPSTSPMKKKSFQGSLESYVATNQSLLSMSVSCPELVEEFQKKELEMMGEELIGERRKNQAQQERIKKQSLKINYLKAKNCKLEGIQRKMKEKCRSFVDFIKKDEEGNYEIQFDDDLDAIAISYNVTAQSQKCLKQFFQILSSLVTGKLYPFEETQDQETTKVMEIIEAVYQENQRIQQNNNALSSEMNDNYVYIDELENNLKESNEKAEKREKQIESMREEMESMSEEMEKLKEMLRSCEGVNSYLKEKDQQMEYIITTKENTIDNLRKMLSNNSNELDQMEEELTSYKKALKNFELVIEEMKEELANKEELIENYETKYGKYKNKRSRELQNQINDCLRWLSQQDTSDNLIEEDSLIKSEITAKKVDRTMLSVVKNHENLEAFTLNDLVHAKEELQAVLEEVRSKIQTETKNNFAIKMI